MKSYRLFEHDMTVLGRRLDAARTCLARAESKWAQSYWQQAIDSLLLQWRYLPPLYDGDALVSIIPKWEVTYDFYETAEALEGYDFLDKYVDRVLNQGSLDISWENHRAQRLMRAQ